MISRRKFIRFILWFCGLFMLLLASFAVILYLNREEIKKTVLDEVNRLLSEPVAVEEVEVSLRKFPYASLAFSEVFSKGANGQNGDTLLYAQKVYFEFSLWNVFTEHLSIHKISLEEGTLNILRPEKGIPNYQIWKEDSSESSSVFTLEALQFQNFRAFQYEGSVDQSTRGFVEELVLSGIFEPESYRIEAHGQLYIDSLVVDGESYLQSANGNTSFVLEGNASAFSIKPGLVELENNEIDFELNSSGKGVQLEATGREIELTDLNRLAQRQNWGVPQGLDLKGKANLSFKGLFEDDKDPDMELTFGARDASLSGYEGARLKSLSCSGVYHSRGEHDRFSLDQFSGKGRSGSFKGNLEVNDLDEPAVILDLQSDLNLSEWLIFLPLDTLTKPEGRALINLHFENRFKSLSNIRPEELKRAKASGDVRLENIGFTFKGTDRRIEDMNADLRFLGNDLKISSFFFRTGKSDIYLEGAFENVLNYVYFEDQKLKVDARLRSQQIQIEDFIVETTDSSSEGYSLEFIKSLDLELQLQLDRFYFDKFYASNINGELQVKNGLIDAKSISLEADEGTFEGNMQVDTRREQYRLQASLNAAGVDVHELFVSFNNFGQSEITSDNLYGTADMDLKISCLMSPKLEIDLPSIVMNSHLEIEEGRLKNYEPMLALSRFADIKELSDVRFATLKNDISILNSQVIIPRMNIKSNVLDMGLSGKHGFDNQIDYSIRLKLSDVLFSKRKSRKKKSEFDEHLTEVEKDDDPNIYVGMRGPVEDPAIQLDRKGISESINEGFQDQGKQLKGIFRKDKKDDKKDDSGIKFDLFGDEKDQ